MRHSDAHAVTATPAETTRASALLLPMSPPMTAPAASGPTSCPRDAPIVKWPKFRSCSAGADWRATIDWAPMTKQRWPSPMTPLHAASAARDEAVPLSAHPPAMSATPKGSSGAQRPSSVRRPSGTAAKSGSSAYTPAMTPMARSSAPRDRAR